MIDAQRLRLFLLAFEGRSDFSSTNIWNVARDTSETVALKIINQFSLSLKAAIEKIDSELARRSQDWESIQTIAHKLAGSSELVGFVHFGRDCRFLMQVNTFDDEVRVRLLDLRRQAVLVIEELNTACPELNTYV